MKCNTCENNQNSILVGECEQNNCTDLNVANRDVSGNTETCADNVDQILKSKYRYIPKTKDELIELVNDSSVSLTDITPYFVKDLSHLFEDNKSRNYDGIEDWDVSNVTDMRCMFENCGTFNSDLSK